MDGRLLAQARDAWFDSDEGRRCLAGEPFGEYLKNRLELAFIAGVNAAQTLAVKKTKTPPPPKQK